MSDRRSQPPPQVELRPFGATMPPRIADIGDLHRELLPNSPVVKLGQPFMEGFYYRVLPAERHIFGAVAYVDSRPAGFVTATADSRGFLRQAARRHFFRIAWLVMRSVLASPRRVAGLWEAARIMRARRQTSGGAPLGEVISIGVLPDYRSRDFRAPTGVHLAEQLMDLALGELQAAGIGAVSAVVDTDNVRSRRFFESKGFRMQEVLPQGWVVPSVEFTLDLSQRETSRARTIQGGIPLAPPEASVSTGQEPVSIIVPCHNEERGLAFLAFSLASLARNSAARYRFHYIFVDDGSTDGTWAALHSVFGEWPDCRFIQHPANRGIAAAILTGLEQANTEIACSIDSDCTYDPRQLAQMIPLLTEGVDLVTASPHHPLGRIAGVPAWRLALSRGASILHRLALGGRLHTYSSCFRVYRRSSVAGMKLAHPGFPGIAEMLHVVVARGGRIVEHPATLEVRTNGCSKVKVVRIAVEHVWLLSRLLRLRLSEKLGNCRRILSREQEEPR